MINFQFTVKVIKTHINKQVIIMEDSITFLGLTIDHNLNWKSHINKV